MFVLADSWIKEAWKQETRKQCSSIKDEIKLTMQTEGKTVHFEGKDMNLEVKILDRETSKKCFRKSSKKKRLKHYKEKGNTR